MSDKKVADEWEEYLLSVLERCDNLGINGFYTIQIPIENMQEIVEMALMYKDLED